MVLGDRAGLLLVYGPPRLSVWVDPEYDLAGAFLIHQVDQGALSARNALLRHHPKEYAMPTWTFERVTREQRSARRT